MKVVKTSSGNYDTEELEYCCPELKSLVIGDGGAIKLNEKGLVLRANPDHVSRRLNFCPNCGAPVEHEDKTVMEQTAFEAPKPLQRDKNSTGTVTVVDSSDAMPKIPPSKP